MLQQLLKSNVALTDSAVVLGDMFWPYDFVKGMKSVALVSTKISLHRNESKASSEKLYLNIGEDEFLWISQWFYERRFCLNKKWGKEIC